MVFKKGYIPYNKGKHFPNNGGNAGSFKKGYIPWNYIDGRSKNQVWNRYGPEWKKIRADIFKRDNYTCKSCGKINTLFHCHHIVPFIDTQDNSYENLVTLCSKCHRLEETRIMKKIKQQED